MPRIIGSIRARCSGSRKILPSSLTRSLVRLVHLIFVRLVLLAAALGLAACGRSTPPAGGSEGSRTAPRAFDLAGHAPRFLVASREIVVPLEVSNRGSEPWNPAAVHLSYHWVWFIPRELPHRSRWNLPYQEGIRSELPAPVAPGARTPVEGRLLAPAYPGLYWLQWDMVEEGLAWFSQEGPRQPRRLVIVIPSLAGLFAPFPLLVALAGLWWVRRIERGRAVSPRAGAFVAAADVVWCAATLFSKQLLLVPEALLEPTAAAYWLMVAIALAPPLVALLVLPRRLRAWTLLIVGIAGTGIILSDTFYYRFFGDVISAPAVLAARQTGHVLGSIRSLTTGGLVWLVIDLPVALLLVVRLDRSNVASRTSRRGQRTAAAAIAAALIVSALWLSVPRVLAESPLDQTFRNRALVEALGPFGYHAYDLWTYARTTIMRPRADDAQIEAARRWFADRATLRAGAGPFFGAARGRNVIVVQVESLQDFVVDFDIDGQQVMPNLRRWPADSIRFTNVTDQTSEGRTSDAELAALV